MTKQQQFRFRRGRTFAVLAGFVTIVLIVLLTLNVFREMRLLQSAQSDNVQWSLSQVEVEFLELTGQLSRVRIDVTDLRRRFDVFYSRIAIIQSATVFEDARASPDFLQHLNRVTAFLDENVGLIDQNDTKLLQSIPNLRAAAEQVRPDIRSLSTTGLNMFAEASDQRRNTVARTLTELAVLQAALIGTLGFGVFYLNRVNNRGRRRQSALRNAMQRINTITSTSLDAVIVSDASGLILEFNPAAETIFGHAAATVVGQDLGATIIPDHFRALHDAGLERMRQGGEKHIIGKGRVTLEAKRANGEVFPVELAIQSAKTDQGEIYIAFLRDISVRVRAETELVKARDRALANEKMKTDFLATMSHEIRTPLNGLLGSMALLQNTAMNAEQMRYLGHMETSGRLLMSHVSDVLDITRYDAGKLSISSVPMNVSELMQDIVDNQGGAASANETTLNWSWAGEPVTWVKSDPDRLQHVLLNLVGNAVKFTKGGKVVVTAQAVEGDSPVLRFDIVDTGPGIDPNQIQRIFDDFVTGNAAYNRSVGGTGLGLSIVKRFVTALGGDSGVESTLGQGSRFWVTLPLVRSEAPSNPEMVGKMAKNSTTYDVLVVEDNEINRMVVREMLQQDGHRVTEAFDGAEGVKAANLKRFDRIFMDISMPVMDGRAATRDIRSGNGPNAATPIIALTANALAEEQANFLDDGMNGILIKPLTRDALREALHGPAPVSLDAPAAPLLDLRHGAETRDAIGPAAFKTLLTRFSDEVDVLLDWLSSDNDENLAEIASRSHKVAGSAAVFGAVALREALKAVETAGKSENATETAARVDTLTSIWARTKRVLPDLL